MCKQTETYAKDTSGKHNSLCSVFTRVRVWHNAHLQYTKTEPNSSDNNLLSYPKHIFNSKKSQPQQRSIC